MVAVVYNSKVAVIGGAESTVTVIKKFPGMFQVSELQIVVVGYCSDTEASALPSSLIALITQGERAQYPRGPFLTRIFSTMCKLHCCSRLSSQRTDAAVLKELIYLELTYLYWLISKSKLIMVIKCQAA